MRRSISAAGRTGNSFAGPRTLRSHDRVPFDPMSFDPRTGFGTRVAAACLAG
jgi:hypothetical protein